VSPRSTLPSPAADVGRQERRAVDHDRRRQGRDRRRDGRCSSAWARRLSIRGRRGAGQHTKMVNQILISTNMIGVCEALLYGYKAGLDLETVFKSVSVGSGGKQGAGGAWAANPGAQLRAGFSYGRALHQGHGHRPGRGEGRWESRLPGPRPGLSKLYLAVQAQGWGRKGNAGPHAGPRTSVEHQTLRTEARRQVRKSFAGRSSGRVTSIWILHARKAILIREGPAPRRCKEDSHAEKRALCGLPLLLLIFFLQRLRRYSPTSA